MCGHARLPARAAWGLASGNPWLAIAIGLAARTAHGLVSDLTGWTGHDLKKVVRKMVRAFKSASLPPVAQAA